jgi:hypothetical protein
MLFLNTKSRISQKVFSAPEVQNKVETSLPYVPQKNKEKKAVLGLYILS